MPLSAPSQREPLHTRRIECRGYRRQDGLWDIEGHLVDTKTYAWHSDYRGEVAPGVPVHEMWLRLTVDDDLVVHAAEAASDHYPFRLCPEVTPNFADLKGLRIGPGWRRRLRELVGGTKGCTHLVELLGPLATTAYQTIFPAREKRARQTSARKRPEFLDTCYALASDGEVVKAHWPEFYTGS
jgi:Protein of unknown function (DUF2889)